MEKATIDGWITVETVSGLIRRNSPAAFRELIRAKAFEESIIKYGVDVALTLDHGRIIAQGPDLEMWEDNIGLRFFAQIDDIETIARALKNELTGCSFNFVPLKTGQETRNKEPVRILERIKLLEVSVISALYGKPVYRSIVHLRYVPEVLRIKAEEYQLKPVTSSEYGWEAFQHRIDELKK